MPKRSRLKFLGIQLTLDEVRFMRGILGYNTDPRYKQSWGHMCRNYSCLDSCDKEYPVAKSLQDKGLVKTTVYGMKEFTFESTDLGKHWFDLYKRHHKHPNLWRQ